MKKKIRLIIFALIPLLILAFDLITKYFIYQDPKPYMQEIIGNFYRHTFVYNEGVVFGIMNNVDMKAIPWIITGMNLVALSVLVYLFLNINKFIKEGKPRIWGQLAIVFITGGALGNMIDRLFLFNEPGTFSVVDFLDVGIGKTRWYTFNVADSFIVIGTIILAILFFFFEQKQKKEETSS